MTGALGEGEDPARITLGRQRTIRPAVFESELRLPRYKGYLLFPDGFPVARISLTADHIARRGQARQRAFVEADPNTTLWHQSGGNTFAAALEPANKAVSQNPKPEIVPDPPAAPPTAVGDGPI